MIDELYLPAMVEIHTPKRVLVTGSAGLIGYTTASFYAERGSEVDGVDNNLRAYFFGPGASTNPNRERLISAFPNYRHLDVDIRNAVAMEGIVQSGQYDLIIHTAAQPSHDWAATDPIIDHDVNARATLVLLEMMRRHSPDSVFLFMSTNKVYGDNPNRLPLIEGRTRYRLHGGHRFSYGINESMSIDKTTHSLFGCSKTAADLAVQEYGRYFGLKTGTLRGGCLTGRAHAGAKQHGFLAYLIDCIASGKTYTIEGYQGKQVRDNLDGRDVIRAFDAFYLSPRPGEVYNIGGGWDNSISILEVIPMIEELLGRRAVTEYNPTARKGDHIWYITNYQKLTDHFGWKPRYPLSTILEEMCQAAIQRAKDESK